MTADELAKLLTPPHRARRYRIETRVLTWTAERAKAVLECYSLTMGHIRATMPGMILAGGAVRDTFFNREVKDLDFMAVDHTYKRLLGDFLRRPLLDCLRNVSEADKAKYEGEVALMSAYETEDKAVNLLVVRSIHERITEGFPDSISQIWTDGKDVYATPHFMQTAATGVITMQHTIKGERVERLKAKYPDFEFEYEI